MTTVPVYPGCGVCWDMGLFLSKTGTVLGKWVVGHPSRCLHDKFTEWLVNLMVPDEILQVFMD